MAFLNELPKTQHDIASFTVDVNTYTVSSYFLPVSTWSAFSSPFDFISLIILKTVSHLQNTLLSFTVSGVFKEGEVFGHHELKCCSHRLQTWVVLFLVPICVVSVFFSRCWWKIQRVNHGLLTRVRHSPSREHWVSEVSSQWLVSSSCCLSHLLIRGKM